jgi:hypothetical protein
LYVNKHANFYYVNYFLVHANRDIGFPAVDRNRLDEP